RVIQRILARRSVHRTVGERGRRRQAADRVARVDHGVVDVIGGDDADLSRAGEDLRARAAEVFGPVDVKGADAARSNDLDIGDIAAERVQRAGGGETARADDDIVRGGRRKTGDAVAGIDDAIERDGAAEVHVAARVHLEERRAVVVQREIARGGKVAIDLK